MRSIIKHVLMVILAFGVGFSAKGGETADGMLKKAASAINGSEGLTATFILDYGQEKITGSLKALGKKFALVTSSASTWYDGKNMWTYNSKNNETTLMNPTIQEVAEANPLSIVNSYSTSFTATFAKSQTKGSRTIILTPKSKQIGYKSVHITIPDGSAFPTKLVVIPSSGSKLTVTISQVKRGQKLPEASFVYPKSKYPKAEIIDLR